MTDTFNHPLFESPDTHIRVVYMSVTRGMPMLSTLENILDASRRNNTENGITGALVFSENKFLQILEGTAGQVRELLRKIERDERHAHMEILSIDTISEHIFSEWSMGYIGDSALTSNGVTLPAIDTMIEKIKSNADYVATLMQDLRKILLVA